MEFTEREALNQDYIFSKGYEFACVRLTKTCLNQGIIDAKEDVRKLLEQYNIHKFDEQEKGPDHKVLVATHILTFQSIIETKTSFYRAKTRGDERMWFGSKINKIARPDDVYAIIPCNSELYLVNISKIDLDMCCTTYMKNPIKEFFKHNKQDNSVSYQLASADNTSSKVAEDNSVKVELHVHLDGPISFSGDMINNGGTKILKYI